MSVTQEMPGSEQATAATGPSNRKKIVSLLVVALLMIAVPAWYVFGRTDRVTTVQADFEYVNGIYTGSKVAVLGVGVGTVTGIEPQGTSVRVTMTVPESVKLPADVSAYVMSPAIISERYIELGPAYTDGPQLPDGTVIPIERTHSPIDIDGMLGSLSTLVDFMGPEAVTSDRCSPAARRRGKARARRSTTPSATSAPPPASSAEPPTTSRCSSRT